MRALMIRVLLGAAALVFAATASAAPVTYGLTNGTITVQANRSTDQELVFNQTINLSVASFVDWDAAGIPASGFGGTMDDFLIAIDGPATPHALEPGISYGPFDTITIESGVIAPDHGAGYDTLLAFPNGPGSFLFQAGGIDITAFYSASHSVTLAQTPGPVEAVIEDVNNMNGTVTFTGGIIQVVMDSVVMGTVDGTPFGEAGNDLVITANINFFGDSNVVPAPEPSTGLLVAMGIAGLAASKRGTRRGC